MDWKDTAKKIADVGLPVLGAALGGPAGGLVGKALASAIGVSSEKPEDVIKALQTDEKARQAAFEFQATHGLALLKLDAEDRKSARDREATTKDNTNKILAFAITGSFVTVVGGSLLGYAQVDSALAGTLVGYLSAKAEQVIAYYFGSTSGSLEKTRLMASGKK